MLPSPADPAGDVTVRFAVRVHPGARDARVSQRDGVLEVYVRAPAREGRATREALAAVADELDVAASRVTCQHGEHSRTKLFSVTGDSDLRQRLQSLLGG